MSAGEDRALRRRQSRALNKARALAYVAAEKVKRAGSKATHEQVTRALALSLTVRVMEDALADEPEDDDAGVPEPEDDQPPTDPSTGE